MSEIKTKTLATADFPSVVHNNEVSEEIVKWGNANNYPLNKAKLVNKMDGYVGFAPTYYIIAKRKPPVPGGWAVSVEGFEPEERIIPLNVDPKGEVNRFIRKMMEQYKVEGLTMEESTTPYNSYGTDLLDVKVTGHPVLINMFEDFIENMR